MKPMLILSLILAPFFGVSQKVTLIRYEQERPGKCLLTLLSGKDTVYFKFGAAGMGKPRFKTGQRYLIEKRKGYYRLRKLRGIEKIL